MEKDKLLVDEIQTSIPRVEISWNDVHFSIESKTSSVEVLKGVSGSADSGEFLAIMGSSGAGKTTLLNMLSDRVQKTDTIKFSGEILANNQEISTIGYTNYIGYVTQEDILIDALTVKECLMFSARLRLSGTYEAINQKVNDLILELKLEKCQNTYIGSQMMKGISGGEKKRTSIGIELITDPSVLFLDEPTSGLDSFTARVVIGLLLQQTKKGRTVISTIHQPSSDIFHMFDKLLLMSDGKILFHGRAETCITYFQRAGFECPQYSNPADYFIEVIHIKRPHNLDDEEKRRVTVLSDLYRSSSLIKRSKSFEIQRLESKNIVRKTGFFFQLYMNFMRFGLRTLRNPMLSVVKIFIMTFIAIMVNIFYFQLGTNGASNMRDRNGVMFFITVNLVFANVQGSVLSFPIMRSLLIKEYNSNMYGVAAFFISKSLVDLLFDIFISLYFGNLIYWGVGLNTTSFTNVAYFFLFALLIHMSGGSLGFLTGSIFKRSEVAMSFTAVTLLPFMYFSGFYRNKNIPVAFSWIENISIFKYGFQGLARNEYEGLDAHATVGGKVVTGLEMLDITMTVRESAMLLAVLMIAFRILALLVLQRLVLKNKS